MPYIGKEPEHGNYQLLDALTLPDGVFNGSRTLFNLTADGVAVYPGSPASLLISLGGVLQEPTTTYTVSGGQITFTTAPATSTDFFGVSLGDTLDIGTPSDASVTAAKIADDAVTADKLANSINTDIAANTAKTGITSGQASAITANTAKVTNATHTGDVTGATALTIAADAVTTVKIANDQVTGAKLNPALVVGDIIYADGTDTITRLAKPGTPAGEVLTFATSATAPSWAAAAAGGKIGQVVQTVKTGTWTSNSDTFDSGSDITGLTVNITPTATSSKILVMFAMSGSQGYNQNRAQYRLVRDSTAIFVGVPEGSNRVAVTGGIATSHASILASTAGGVYVDDPFGGSGTVSAVTYKLQMKQQTNAPSSSYVYINRSSTTWNDDSSTVVSASSIVVMEVLA